MAKTVPTKTKKATRTARERSAKTPTTAKSSPEAPKAPRMPKSPPKAPKASKSSPKAPKAPKSPPKQTSLDEADPRFFPVAEALRPTPGFALMESKSGALRGMMLNGKSFGMSSHGRFILKLNEERALSLIGEGIGKSFGARAGTVMKGWIEITHPQADWVALAKEAQHLAAAQNRAKAKKPGR